MSTHQETVEPGGAEHEAERSSVLESGIYQPWKPPSKEEIKRELKAKKYTERQYQQEYERNRKEAIKEILQENVRDTVSVKDNKLLSKFNEGMGGE